METKRLLTHLADTYTLSHMEQIISSYWGNELFYKFNDMTLDQFKRYSNIEYRFSAHVDGCRIDEVVSITEFGEEIARFMVNVAN